MAEEWYHKVQREAGEKLEALLALPIADDCHFQDAEKDFDPWELFGAIYGSYSADFDETAIQVLEDFDQEDWSKKRKTLAHEMIREMLCVAELCEYGSSPRTCWPTERFKPLLPRLLEKWKAYYEMQWGEPYSTA